MWHEARKHEKKIRGMMVDYKRRAERRREFYEKIKKDPAQFLQLHGRQMKICIDPMIGQSLETNMMPWQGQPENMIDRFDVRAHLDYILESKPASEPPKSAEEMLEQRQANYERYRILVQNEFIGIPEDKFLHQIWMEERYGTVGRPGAEEEKRRLADRKAAIGYIYEDSTITTSRDDHQDEKDDDESDVDLEQSQEMNRLAEKYGMVGHDFMTYLLRDKEEMEAMRLAKEQEEAIQSGRKSRREKKQARDRSRNIFGRRLSPPSYAARESPTYNPYQRVRHLSDSPSPTHSRSPTPADKGVITYITSFGGESDSEEERSKKTASGRNRSHQTVQGSGASLQTPIIGPQLPPKRSPQRNWDSWHRKGHSRKDCSSRSSSSHQHSTDRHKTQSRLRDRHWTHHDRKRYRTRSPGSSKRKWRSRSRLVSATAAFVYHPGSSSPQRASSLSKSPSRSSSSSSQTTNVAADKDVDSSLDILAPVPQPPPPQKSYYEQIKGLSSDELSNEEEEEENKTDNMIIQAPKSPTGTLPGLHKNRKHNPRDKLMRKMQAQLNKQYKADKKAEKERREKQEQERIDREEELRELSIKLRKRERERRHRIREEEDYDDLDGRPLSSSEDSRHSSPSTASRTPSPPGDSYHERNR